MTITIAPEAREEADVVVVPEPPRRSGGRGAHRGLRQVAGWLLLAVSVIALWPASLGGMVGLTVVSGHSMEPTYHTGDLVVTVRQASYEPGEIVSYVVPDGQLGAGGRVIHRIVRTDDGRYTTQGDNNPQADAWTFGNGDVIGRAVAVLPGVGRLWSPQLLPFVLAAIAGAMVTVLLWPTKRAGSPTRVAEDPDNHVSS